MIGIIGAMPEEVSELLEQLSNPSTEQMGPFELHSGNLFDHSVLIAQCGISKVNAAALTQALIFKGVSKIIFTGVAGGLDPKLKVGDIVISHDCVQHDADVTALGYKLGEVPYEAFPCLADETLKQQALKAANTLENITVMEGRIASGDQFIASSEKAKELHEQFDAACAEMEGAAVAQIAQKWNIPFVIIRSISDTSNHDANTDFKAFTVLAANRAKQVVMNMLEAS